MQQYFVYILAGRKYGTLYVGVTNDVYRRVKEHKIHLNRGFTEKYKIHHLVYYERFDYIMDAIAREKQLKKWRRNWKVELIEKFNPAWKDLYNELVD